MRPSILLIGCALGLLLEWRSLRPGLFRFCFRRKRRNRSFLPTMSSTVWYVIYTMIIRFTAMLFNSECAICLRTLLTAVVFTSTQTSVKKLMWSAFINVHGFIRCDYEYLHKKRIQSYFWEIDYFSNLFTCLLVIYLFVHSLSLEFIIC